MSRIQARRRLGAISAEGRRPLGAFVMSTDASMTSVFGRQGYDFVIIDGEHGPNDRATFVNHVRAAEQNRTIPFVRVLENNPALIQSVLDIGAHGVVVPKVGSAEEAERAVRASLYQRGGRGVCSVVEAARWGADDWSEHAANCNREVLVIPLIETADGVSNFHEIAAVPGVDYAFFGHADLSQDLGFGFGEGMDRLREAWAECSAVARTQGVRLGCHLPAGFAEPDFGTITADMKLIVEGADRVLSEYRNAG